MNPKKDKLRHQLRCRFGEILEVPPEGWHLGNPLIEELVKSTMANQVIFIDTNKHCIVGLPIGEQNA